MFEDGGRENGVTTGEGKDMVAVVVPLFREELTSDERLSLRHLTQFLWEHDKFVISPRGLKLQLSGFSRKQFADAWFSSVSSYSRLLLSREFYEAFAAYRYILIYQLDALVFSDQLLAWCEQGYDYIGAPWFKSRYTPSRGFSRVGNGGFSLRKINSVLAVLNSQRYVTEPAAYWGDVFTTPLLDVRDEFKGVRQVIKRLKVFREVREGVRHYVSNYTLNEDHFWSDRARLFHPEFKVAPIDVGLRFAFEFAPGHCFAQNDYQLPFGCHAWTRWDRRFWEPFLLR